jgi:hypothetical protein
MAMFFFLSGLFVWPGLSHKSSASFIRNRLLRLGIPFVVCAFTVIPVAYYSISLRLHPEIGFAEFWWRTVTAGPWPSGPIWFVWLLLVFGLTACRLYRPAAALIEFINRISERGFEHPALLFRFLFAVSAIFYVPAVLYFGANRWFEFGPFSVQACRILLYATYFCVGVGVGAANFERGILSSHGRLAESSSGWIVATSIPYGLMWVMIGINRIILGNPNPYPQWFVVIYDLLLAGFSAAIMLAILGFFLRFNPSSRSLLDPMQADAYGMFLIHYPIAFWLQYWLFDYELPEITKAAIGFVLTVILSWALTAALRTIPGATRVL